VTPANAEVVRRLAEVAWRDRDIDAALEMIDPNAVFDWSDSRAPYGGRFDGHRALREFFQVFVDAWEEWNVEFEEVIEADLGTVLIVTHVIARGKGSGVPVEAHGASIWSVRDGRVMGAKLFQSKDEALAALGRESP
jgi:ketosteroid isomerase-like protein